MSARHLPRVISQRGKTAVEIERENFEKNQTVAINKAINAQETPVKEKHLRSTILGTFQDNGGSLFWAVVSKLPLQGNPIICWKFCNVLHKLLREGHPNVYIDSIKYRSHLKDLGKLWGHLKEGYGRLIAAYCHLLIQKMIFHRKNNQIPGHLKMSDEQFARVCASDVNNYFEISVDMLDYMDEILNLQQTVFGSLDMSRSNSMTNSGQCRLAPLILCIQDSCQLYDYIVKSLFKLHSSLPPDTLAGHRDRFLSGYKRLKQFYFNSSNLQYFKHLVQVPLLPDEPPNFLIASDFNKHVKPVAVVPEPEPEPEIETEVVEDLIDTSEPQNDRFEQTFGNSMGNFAFNGKPPEPEPDERDLLIERLSREIQQLRAELERVKAEDAKRIQSLQDEIAKLDKILSELRFSADKSLKENSRLEKELETATANTVVVGKLEETEKHAKTNEEKFKKMKDVYTKLREEHVTLLRTNAEVTKQMAADKQILEEKEQIIKESKSEMARLEQERSVIQNSLQQSADEVTTQLATAVSHNSELDRKREELETEVKSLEETRSDLESQLQKATDDMTDLTAQLQQTQTAKQEQEEQLTSQVAALQGDLQQSQEERQALEQKLTLQITDIQTQLDQTQGDKTAAEERLTKNVQELEQQLQQTQTAKQEQEEQLNSQVAALQGDLQQSQEERQALEQTLTLQITDLQTRLDQTEADKAATEERLSQRLQELEKQLQQTQSDKDSTEHKLNQDIDELHRKLIENSIQEGRAILQDAMDQFENPSHMTSKCTADFLLLRIEPVLTSLEKLKNTHTLYGVDRKDLESFVRSVTAFSHHMGDCIIHGIATSHSPQLEAGEELSGACRKCGENGLEVLNALEKGGDISPEVTLTTQNLQHLMKLTEALLPKMVDVKSEEIESLVDNEMTSTAASIEKAAARIAEMLEKTRQDTTGVELEVNERILDACTTLMKAIRVLVEKSRDLQKEIVSQGRGTASAKDFYKKNHRWTEGLLSAAKAVGWGATALMEAADKVVKGEGKFEELIVCSTEIAASTAQLVVSSKVKSDRNSKCMKKLSEASKGVSEATGNVVASAKAGSQQIEDQNLMDFSHMSLMQAKKNEMQSQVRVLELESDLEKERIKLSELRKKHYQMAGESEGWEVDQVTKS